MKNRVLISLFLGSVLFLTGCATTHVQSVRNPEFTGSMESVFVIVKFAGASPDTFVSLLSNGIESDLQASGVRTTVRTVTGLELEDPDYDAEIKEFNPQYVMLLIQTGQMLHNGGQLAGSTFDASIVDVQSGTRVWRANLKTTTDGMAGAASIGISARKKLMEQLIKDKIILEKEPQ